MNCPCGTSKQYAACCEPLHDHLTEAPSAEALMRSRYSAFALKKMDYIQDTTDPQTRQNYDPKANAEWASQANFTKLEIVSAEEQGNKAQVEFKAYFEMAGEPQVHHEKSKFRKQAGSWFFREGKVQAAK